MTIEDPWHERPCVVCDAMFKPRTHGRRDAAKAKCCGMQCAGRLGAKSIGDLTRGRTADSSCRALTELELTPCTACGLRGHLALDPDKCLGSSNLVGATRGLGGQSWV